MQTSSSASATVASRLIMAAFGGLLIALLFSLVTPVRADAAYFAGSSGRIGSVSLNGPMLVGSDWRTNGYAGTSIWWRAWEVGGFVVTRSPSSTAVQRVDGVSTIQRWDGRWVDIQSRSWSGTVSGNGTLTFPAWNWTPSSQPNNRASYRVNYQITWRVWATNQLLAYTAILPSTYADSRCRMIQLACTSYTDGNNF